MGADQSRAEQQKQARLHLEQYRRIQAMYHPPASPLQEGQCAQDDGFQWVEVGQEARGSHEAPQGGQSNQGPHQGPNQGPNQEAHSGQATQAVQGGQSDQGPKREQTSPAEWRMDDDEDVLELVARYPLVDISIMGRSVEDIQHRLSQGIELPELPLPVDTRSELRVYLAGWQKLKRCWPCESYVWGSNFEQQDRVA